MKILIIFALLICFPIKSKAQEKSSPTIIAVGEAQLAKQKIAFTIPLIEGIFGPKQKELVNDSFNIILNDLNFYKKYFEVPESDDLDESVDTFTFSNPKWKTWKESGNEKDDCCINKT